MQYKGILVLNLVPNTVGDSIIMLPVFSIFKKNFPGTRLVVTGDSLSKELWSDNREIDEIIEVKEISDIGNPKLHKLRKAAVYLKMMFGLIKKIKKYRFDICFVMYPNFLPMPLIPYIAGIKERVGYTYKGSFTDFLLTKKAQSKMTYDGYYHSHIVDSFLGLLRIANIRFSESDVVCRKDVAKADIDFVKKKLSVLGMTHKKNKILCLHTMSKAETRNWPKERFKELLVKLLKKYPNLVAVILGSKKEKEYNTYFKHERVFNLCGEFSLKQTGALLHICDLFVGNDSGLAHYASSVGANVIALFGASDPAQAKPIGYGKTEVIFKNTPEKTYNFALRGDKDADFEAMRKINVEDVLEKAVLFLK
jgi:ADP-heptose:LPS heptosyltransferase